MTAQPGGAVVVAGLGMAAALGPDVHTNCAAARAGLGRCSPIESYRGRSVTTGAPEPFIGHQASLFTRGFEGDARLVRLAQAALSDLRAQTPNIDWGNSRHAFYLSLPDPRRVHTGAELIADEEARRAWIEEQEAGPTDEAPSGGDRAARILSQAARLVAWPAPAVLRFVSVAGHAGGLAAVRAAAADMSGGATNLAVVLGVDSLLDEPTLRWLICAAA